MIDPQTTQHQRTQQSVQRRERGFAEMGSWHTAEDQRYIGILERPGNFGKLCGALEKQTDVNLIRLLSFAAHNSTPGTSHTVSTLHYSQSINSTIVSEAVTSCCDYVYVSVLCCLHLVYVACSSLKS